MTEIQEEEIDLREYINVLLKRKGIIILIFLIAVITAAIVSYFVLTPIYQSSASFKVSTEYMKQPYYYPSSFLNPCISDILILLTSDSILKKAAERINLDYNYEEIKKKIQTKNIKDTNIITLTIEDKNPKMAKKLANTIIEVFIDKHQEKYDYKRKLSEENLKLYEESLNEIDNNILEIEKTRRELLKTTGLSEGERQFQNSLLLSSLINERSIRNSLIDRISSLKVDLMNYKGFEVITPAITSNAPIKPNRKLNILIAGVLGLFVGIFVAFFLEFWQKGKK